MACETPFGADEGALDWPGVAFDRTSIVLFDCQHTSTVNMMALAPSLSTFSIRLLETERSLLRYN